MAAIANHSGDIATLFVILALVLFAAAGFLAYRRDFAAALVTAFIAVLVLIFAL